MLVVLFFFKQKTAYEMRISDWSSDVCSSDLDGRDEAQQGHDQRNLEVKRAAGSDAEGPQQQHGLDVEGVESEDPVLPAWAYLQAVLVASSGHRPQYLFDVVRPEYRKCLLSCTCLSFFVVFVVLCFIYNKISIF